MFFITTTTTTNSPQSTINAPQIHHQKTTRKTRIPLQNRTLHHQKKIIRKNQAPS
jgi:hypothetical protein